MLIAREILETLQFDKAAGDYDLGWGWRFLVMGRAKRLGLALRHFVFDAPCPADAQSEVTDAANHYRLKQMEQNIRGLVRGLGAATK